MIKGHSSPGQSGGAILALSVVFFRFGKSRAWFIFVVLKQNQERRKIVFPPSRFLVRGIERTVEYRCIRVGFWGYSLVGLIFLVQVHILAHRLYAVIDL